MPMTRSCFVIMPIGRQRLVTGEISAEALRERYTDLIREAILKARPDFDVVRADEVQRPGSITADIFRRLIESDYVVADVTFPNPNVFYELGIRNACRPGTVLIRDNSGPAAPFDISVLRYIGYDNTPSGLKKLADNLRDRFDWLEAHPLESDNDFLEVAAALGLGFGQSRDLQHKLNEYTEEFAFLTLRSQQLTNGISQYREVVRTLATRHRRGRRFSEYHYEHIVEQDAADSTIRTFTIESGDQEVGWFFFETGATSDSDQATVEDLNIVALDLDLQEQLAVVPFVDEPYQKALFAVFTEPVPANTKRRVQVRYRWPGAWRGLLRNLTDEAPLGVEGAPGRSDNVAFSIAIAPELGLRVKSFRVSPRIGNVDIADDRLRVEWKIANPPPDTYRWRLVCDRESLL